MKQVITTQQQFDISSLEQLQQVAAIFSAALTAGQTVYLQGDLGAGKTTFTQFLLAASGVKEHVKSPTYTLYETYQTNDKHFIHMDLYRLTDPEELFFLGIEDLINGSNVLLVEWPQKGNGVMPKPDWRLEFKFLKLNRSLTITSEN
jgi:tRNA threonylcarbamoyladenosine biosynthesis protein TsaE